MGAKRGFPVSGPLKGTGFRQKPRLEDVLSWTSDFSPVATPAGMHTCYLELNLSTGTAGLVVQHLSCKTLPRRVENPQFCWKWSLEQLLLTLS